MNSFTKKIVSIMLVVLLVITVAPTAYAFEETEAGYSPSEEDTVNTTDDLIITEDTEPSVEDTTTEEEPETEKEELQAQINEKNEEQMKVQEELLRIQTRIAELAGAVEDGKNNLIELLNNRSSTRAKIQKYDTMMEQIQVRKSELNQRLLSAESEAVEYDEAILQFEKDNKVVLDNDGVIDIIAKEGEMLVIVEVKARKNEDFMFAEDAVDEKKIRNIRTYL